MEWEGGDFRGFEDFVGGVIAAVATATFIGTGAFFFKGCLCERENHVHIPSWLIQTQPNEGLRNKVV